MINQLNSLVFQAVGTAGGGYASHTACPAGSRPCRCQSTLNHRRSCSVLFWLLQRTLDAGGTLVVLVVVAGTEAGLPMVHRLGHAVCLCWWARAGSCGLRPLTGTMLWWWPRIFVARIFTAAFVLLPGSHQCTGGMQLALHPYLSTLCRACRSGERRTCICGVPSSSCSRLNTSECLCGFARAILYCSHKPDLQHMIPKG